LVLIREVAFMKKSLFAIAVVAVLLAGCVVVPAHPVHYHPAAVVVY
jgi:PBP1b-binding outer membrane lipoprotein LpoB